MGKSVAILGGAGCGKSHLLQVVLTHAREKLGRYPVITPCAPSNQVADKIGGRSIHSTFGAYPHWPWSKDGLWSIIAQKPAKLRALREMKILVIDEIFLLTSTVLDCIDHVLRKLAPTEIDGSMPFGGRQVIFSGDEFQLPEIKQSSAGCIYTKSNSFKCGEDEEDGPVHCSRSWFLTFGGFGSGNVVLLDVNHRQAEDPYFYNILQRTRVGDIRIRDLDEINGTSRDHVFPPNSHTQLFLHKDEVDRRNEKMLADIEMPLHNFQAEDRYVFTEDAYLMKRLEQTAPTVLYLKVGCAVLLSANIGGFNAGTSGIVTDIITGIGTSRLNHIQVCIQGRTLGLTPYCFSIRAGDTTVLAERKQFPLIPAYALTVHRSQGMTLQKVAMDFKPVQRWKPCGMVYVVLSRCTSLKGLWVKSLKPEHIVVNPRATDLMSKVEKLRSHYPNRVISSAKTATPLHSISLNEERTNRVYKRQKKLKS